MIERLKELAGRYSSKPLPRLIMVSALQNGFFYLLALFQVSVGWKTWQTFAVNYPAAVLFSFFMNRGWVFAGRDRPKGQFARYIAVYVAAYGFSVGFSAALESIGIFPALAIILTMIPTAVGLFVALNFWVFPTGAPRSRL